MSEAAIRSTPVPALLARQPAVVLERIARGGGATNWYLVRSVEDIAQLNTLLSPGSDVTFYFEKRFVEETVDSAFAERVAGQVARAGELVIAVPSARSIVLTAMLVAGPVELSEALTELNQGAVVLVGPYPRRDADGINAVTLRLPDRDGIVRDHPH
jgi:hypothetical protein